MNPKSLRPFSDWKNVLTALSDFGTSDFTRNLLIESKPLQSVSEIEAQFDQTELAILHLRTQSQPRFESLDFYSVWKMKITKASVLLPSEFRDVRLFLEECLAASEQLLQSDVFLPWASQLALLKKSKSAVDAIIGTSGEVKRDASSKLLALFEEKERVARRISQTLDKLVKDHSLEPVLQDRFVTTREGRWVLPVKSGMQHDFAGITHGSSQSKQTVYMEPQSIVPLNNDIRKLESEIEEEIERLLSELTRFLKGQADLFEAAFETAVALDLIMAKAKFAIRISSERPQVGSEDLELIRMKHPLLVLSDSKGVVGNSVHLHPEKRALILSGPNAGGKTVFMKSIGLAALMANHGLFVCAALGSRIPLFEEIEFVLGDAQDVETQMSTFAGHLELLKSTAQRKGPRSLVLVDEICGATDPEEGGALARAFVEHYSRAGVYGVLTSHLSVIKSGWSEKDAVVVGSMYFDNKTELPTYKFIEGVSGESFAIQTAKRVHVPDSIVNRAAELLSPVARERLNLQSDLKKETENVLRLRAELEKLKSDYEQQVTELKAQQLQFENEKLNRIESLVSEFERKIEEELKEKTVESVFEKQKRLLSIRQSFPEIVKAKAGQNKTDSLAPLTPEEFSKKFPPGTKVFIRELRQDGIVQGEPDSRGYVPVLSQSLRIHLPYQELTEPNISTSSTSHRRLPQEKNSGVAASGSGLRTLDLRGLRAEEAVRQLDEQIDLALRADEDKIKIIHGHGTESLKKAVRNYLSRSVTIIQWTSGQDDGITWAHFKG